MAVVDIISANSIKILNQHSSRSDLQIRKILYLVAFIDVPLEFTQNYSDPMLRKISSENKTCALLGDFNVDLLKTENHTSTNHYYNTLLSHFFTPFILQPTQPESKTVNIFVFRTRYQTFYSQDGRRIYS